jgi:hypothetical protein
VKESAFERKAMRELSKLPNSHWEPKEIRPTVRGKPDRIGCINGKFIALEFKRSMKAALKKSSTSAVQLHTLHQMQAAGAYAVLIYPEIYPRIYAELKALSCRK